MSTHSSLDRIGVGIDPAYYGVIESVVTTNLLTARPR
jgi:hypothetical protein